ncbi:hypothetical protein ACOI9R_39060, partial [Mesorhizobium japonicum]
HEDVAHVALPQASRFCTRYSASFVPASEPITVAAVDALVAAADLVNPEAVLVAHSIEGREGAARFAVRRRAALNYDAVGVSRDEEGVV